jgi:hypothetical protein
MMMSPMQTLSRHPGERRDPLNKRLAGSADRAEEIYWAPAFAGVTVGVERDRKSRPHRD